MKSRRRDRDPGKRKGGGGGGTREDDGVMSMGRGIEVVKENKVLEVKEVGRLRPLNMVSSRTFFNRFRDSECSGWQGPPPAGTHVWANAVALE